MKDAETTYIYTHISHENAKLEAIIYAKNLEGKMKEKIYINRIRKLNLKKALT